MRCCYILILLFLSILPAYGAETTNMIRKAESKFKSGEMLAGKTLLESLLTAENLSDGEKATVNAKLAWFYEECVGNYANAERYSRKVLRFSLPASHRAVIESGIRIQRIKRNAIKYQEENRILKKMKIDASSRNDAEKKIAALESLIHNRPEYPDLSVAYHYIGKNYLYLEKYYKSYRVFSKVLKTRPGIIFLVPTAALMEQAKSKWNYFLVSGSARLIILISLLTISTALFLSKFWEWMSLTNFLMLPILTGAWALFLLGGAWGLNFFIPDQKPLYLVAPVFIQSNPFSPGSGILLTIFLYGVLVLTGSFLLTLAIRGFQWPKLGILINCLVPVLFSSSVFTIFYLNNCYAGGIFEKRANSAFPVIAGHTYLREKDYEPLILTNPRRYPALNLSNSSDKNFIEWVNRQYSIIERQSADGSAGEQ